MGAADRAWGAPAARGLLELAAEFPITRPYQWSRRLLGGAYGWFSGWVAVSAYAVANTTIAYLGAPWALALLEIEATPSALVAGMVLVVVCALVGAAGIRVLKRAVQGGILAEATALLGTSSRSCSCSASTTSRS